MDQNVQLQKVKFLISVVVQLLKQSPTYLICLAFVCMCVRVYVPQYTPAPDPTKNVEYSVTLRTLQILNL